MVPVPHVQHRRRGRRAELSHTSSPCIPFQLSALTTRGAFKSTPCLSLFYRSTTFATPPTRSQRSHLDLTDLQQSPPTCHWPPRHTTRATRHHGRETRLLGRRGPETRGRNCPGPGAPFQLRRRPSPGLLHRLVDRPQLQYHPVQQMDPDKREVWCGASSPFALSLPAILAVAEHVLTCCPSFFFLFRFP